MVSHDLEEGDNSGNNEQVSMSMNSKRMSIRFSILNTTSNRGLNSAVTECSASATITQANHATMVEASDSRELN